MCFDISFCGFVICFTVSTRHRAETMVDGLPRACRSVNRLRFLLVQPRGVFEFQMVQASASETIIVKSLSNAQVGPMDMKIRKFNEQITFVEIL